MDLWIECQGAIALSPFFFECSVGFGTLGGTFWCFDFLDMQYASVRLCLTKLLSYYSLLLFFTLWIQPTAATWDLCVKSVWRVKAK